MIKNNFVEEIELICKEKNTEYIDAVVMWCEKNNLKYKITNCRKLSDEELYNLISSGTVSLSKRYKDKFDQKYKNGK